MCCSRARWQRLAGLTTSYLIHWYDSPRLIVSFILTFLFLWKFRNSKAALRASSTKHPPQLPCSSSMSGLVLALNESPAATYWFKPVIQISFPLIASQSMAKVVFVGLMETQRTAYRSSMSYKLTLLLPQLPWIRSSPLQIVVHTN